MDSISEIRTYDLYYDKLDQYLSVPTTLRQGKCRLEGKQHTIEFRHVSYRYPGSNIYALEDVNVVIHPGEKLLIVGENGAGKTTFIKLLTRLYDPTDGEILLDGTNIREIDYDWYMDLFSAVFQDFKLFPFSLKENIAIEQPENPQHVENILRNIGFGRRLDQLPKGLDTEITKVFDEMGFEPSGGEGQKISLARALYKNTDFVILDEPTAALDPRAEFELYQNFSELVDGKTAVFISHRMGSAKFCDMIAVFSKGKIVEYGSHDALIKQSGMYSEYYKMQAEQYI
jgi:ATP-binding cassette subfamily B protein/ATP-binding cassette subfamily C protein